MEVTALCVRVTLVLQEILFAIPRAEESPSETTPDRGEWRSPAVDRTAAHLIGDPASYMRWVHVEGPATVVLLSPV